MSTIHDHIREISAKRGLSVAALKELVTALYKGRLKKAEFNHPDLGGIGLWARGEIIIGNMNDEERRVKIWNAIEDLLPVMTDIDLPPKARHEDSTRMMPWWGDIRLGRPVSQGVHKNLTFGYFLETHRVIIHDGSELHHYDASGLPVTGIGISFGDRGMPTVVLHTIDGDVFVSSLRPLNSG